MAKLTTKRTAIYGLMISLVFLATYFTHIPTPLPGGYFNLGDAVIMVSAIILGRTGGLLAGAIGSCLADLAFGAFLFAPITLIVKGLEGLVVGAIASGSLLDNKLLNQKRVIAVLAGAIVMVGGYFAAESYLLIFFDKSFGITAALTELPINLLQGGLSVVVGYALSVLLIRINIRKLI